MIDVINIPLLVPKPLWTCLNCNGRGWELVRTGIDEWDKDVCRFCDGHKYVECDPERFLDY